MLIKFVECVNEYGGGVCVCSIGYKLNAFNPNFNLPSSQAIMKPNYM